EKARNKHIAGKSRDEFVAMRTQRDSELGMPQLIIPSIQVNMRAGRMPPPDEDGQVYLKTPINLL
ncbi:MAG: MBL fold metallo-hydrolase, partial [Pseudomonadota bacterium]